MLREAAGEGAGGRILGWARPSAAALLTGAVGLYGLAEKSFWIDEGATGWAVVRSWGDLWVIATQHEPNLGLYYSMLKLWSIFGTSEFVLRLFSLLCMVAAAPLLYALGRRLFGPRVGFIAGLLFGVNAFVLRYAQDARPYALAVLTVTATSLLYVIALEKGSARWWAAYTTAAVVMVFADPWSAAVIAVHAVALCFNSQRPPWRPVVLTGLFLAAIIGPFFFRVMTTDVDRLDWIPPTSWEVVVRAIQQIAGGTRELLGLYLAAGLVAVAAFARRRRPEWPLLYVSLLAALPLLLILAVSMVKPVFVGRYTIVALPGIILLVAVGLDRLRSAWIVAIATTVFAVAAVPGLRRWYDSDLKADWRTSAAIVAEHRTPDDFVLVNRFGSSTFLYYDRFLPVADVSETDPRAIADLHDRVWLVIHQVPTDDAVATFDEAFGETHRFSRAWSLNDLVLRLYVRAS